MMSELTLPAGYIARPPTMADVPGVAEVISAYELDAFGRAETTEAWLIDDWREINLAEEALIITGPGGQVVAAADVDHPSSDQVRVYGYVHPAERGRGLGTYLVRWGDRWARAQMTGAAAESRITVQHYPAAADESAQQLLAALGYTPSRSYHMMEMTLDEAPPPPEWPDDITVRTFVPGQDEQAAFGAFAESFQDHFGPPEQYEPFLKRIEADSFDPELWFLAFDGDEMAGVCFSKLIDESGWVDNIGVRRPWRRRGLGFALLRQAIAALYERGAKDVGLSVDTGSVTGAPRLYLRAGMRVNRSYILHQKELRSAYD